MTISAVLMNAHYSFAQNSNIDASKLPAHIKLKNSFIGVNTQDYIDAVSKADFDRYRYQDKIRILKFESGVEFQLMPLNGNSNARPEMNYQATLKLLPSGKIVQLVPYDSGTKKAVSERDNTLESVNKPRTSQDPRQGADKPQVEVSQAPVKPVKKTEMTRLKQMEEIRNNAIKNGYSTEKYDKAIEALRKQLEQQKKGE